MNAPARPGGWEVERSEIPLSSPQDQQALFEKSFSLRQSQGEDRTRLQPLRLERLYRDSRRVCAPQPLVNNTHLNELCSRTLKSVACYVYMQCAKRSVRE